MPTMIQQAADETAEVLSNPPHENSAFKWIVNAGEILLVIFVTLFAVMLFKAFVVGTYEIPSESMLNTIEIGDRVAAERVSYKFREPSYGEIVTFKDPQEEKRTLIKRVIAVGGQSVDLIDGKVFIDNQELQEDYVVGQTDALINVYGESFEYPYEIPEGYIWVMGDNREASADSRYFGPISVEDVTGHAIFRYWPFNKFGGL